MLINDDANKFFAKREYPGDYMVPESNLLVDGDQTWLYHFIEDSGTEMVKDFRGIAVEESCKIYKKIGISKLDKDNNPVLKKNIVLSPSKTLPQIILLAKDPGTLKYLVASAGSYGILTLGTDISYESIKSDLFKGSVSESFVPLGNSYIADSENGYFIYYMILWDRKFR